MRFLVLAAIAVASVQPAPPDARTLLDRTVWIDIGTGRRLAKMKAQEIAALERCKVSTLYFEKTGNGLAETFYPGMTMRTEYERVALTRADGKTVVLLYNANSAQPAERLQLTNGDTVLVQQSRGFRPHTFLRCSKPM